jgi:hypothetical protein
MTIVAGFCVQDGLLLCADSQYTGGTKVHQPKLFGYTINSGIPESCTLAFALAGHENFGKMAIDDCVESITDCKPKERTMAKIKRLLRKAIKSINDEYVDTRPTDAEKEAAKFDLIIGAWLPMAGGLRMFRSSGPAVLLAGAYHCTGIGAYLGDYLMRDVFDRQSMDLNDVMQLATQALLAAKSYDANCGGDTQFMAIYPGGKISPVVPFDVRHAENYAAAFDKSSRRLLLAIGNLKLTDEYFQEWLRSFTMEVERMRTIWKSESSAWERLREMLSKIKTTGQQDPESTKHDPSPQPPLPE